MRRRKQRFRGAGGSSEHEFARRRRQNIREQWHVWLFVTLGILGFAAWSLLVSGMAARALAAAAGVIAGVLLVVWSLGGHYSAFHWWLGAEGERETGGEIEKLVRNGTASTTWNMSGAIGITCSSAHLESSSLTRRDSTARRPSAATRCALGGLPCRVECSAQARKGLSWRWKAASAHAHRGCSPWSWCGVSFLRHGTRSRVSSTCVARSCGMAGSPGSPTRHARSLVTGLQEIRTLHLAVERNS